MIELEVEEYCHNCPRFKADVDVHDYVFKIGNTYHTDVTTIITCVRAKQCKSIFDYFMKTYEVHLKPVKIETTLIDSMAREEDILDQRSAQFWVKD